MSHIYKSVVRGFGFGGLLKIAVIFHALIMADFFLDSFYKDVLAQGKEAILLVKKPGYAQKSLL